MTAMIQLLIWCTNHSMNDNLNKVLYTNIYIYLRIMLQNENTLYVQSTICNAPNYLVTIITTQLFQVFL